MSVNANLKFGSKELTHWRDENGDEYEVGDSKVATGLKIGCTWGTYEEIKAILDACEKLS